MSVPKYRRPLNNEQIEVLKLLYIFRFGNNQQIARHFSKSDAKFVQKRLKILEDQGFIAKHYDKSYKLQGKPAAYYLSASGGRLLKVRFPDDQKITDQGIKNLYKNKHVSADFINHCLVIFKVYLHLKTIYANRLMFFTKNQMIAFSYFPGWPPDAYLALKNSGGADNTRFFLDVFDGTKPFFVSVRKIRNYLNYAEAGDWDETNADFPILLAICDHKRSETKLRRQIRRALEESSEEPVFATTTMELLLAARSNKTKIWRTVDEDDELLTLGQIQTV